MAESPRFIKLNDTQETKWLLTNHPNSFLLLTIISCRARRQNGHFDGLIIGDALISAADLKPGVSRQKFRTALEKLVELNYIEIISNGKRFFERQKSTINITINCHLVNLCNTNIYDINIDDSNQDANQLATNEQPTDNQRATINKKELRIDISNDISLKQARCDEDRPRSRKDLIFFDFQKLDFEGISKKDFDEWTIMYPHVDLKSEVLKAKNWLISNPTKNKKKNWRKYLTGWLGRSNESNENKKAYRSTFGGISNDRSTKDINGHAIKSPYAGKF